MLVLPASYDIIGRLTHLELAESFLQRKLISAELIHVLINYFNFFGYDDVFISSNLG